VTYCFVPLSRREVWLFVPLEIVGSHTEQFRGMHHGESAWAARALYFIPDCDVATGTHARSHDPKPGVPVKQGIIEASVFGGCRLTGVMA